MLRSALRVSASQTAAEEGAVMRANGAAAPTGGGRAWIVIPGIQVPGAVQTLSARPNSMDRAPTASGSNVRLSPTRIEELGESATTSSLSSCQ